MEDAAETTAHLQEELANLRSVLSAQQAELKRQQHQLSQQQHLQEQLLLLQQHSHQRRHQTTGAPENVGSGTVTLLHRSSTSSLVLPANASLPPTRLSSPTHQPVGCTTSPCASSASAFQLPSFLTQHVLPFFSMGLPSPLPAPPPRADEPLPQHPPLELARAGSGQSHGERRASLTAVPSTSLPSLFSPSPPPPPSPSSRPPPLCGPLTCHPPPPPLGVDQETLRPSSVNSTSRLLLVLRGCIHTRQNGEATDDMVRLTLQQYLVNKLRGHPVLRVISEDIQGGGGHALQSTVPGIIHNMEEESQTCGSLWKFFRRGRQEKARGPFKYVTISAEADKLLLVLEETGGLKLLESGVFYAPYRASCKKFFKGGRKDSRLFLTPNEAVELLRLELFAMRFGKDSPYPSLQGLSVMEVCVAAGVVEDLFPLHQLPLLSVLHYKSGCWIEETGKKKASIFTRLGCRKRYPVLKRKDESSDGFTALSGAVASSASYDLLVAAYFGYPAAAFFLFLRCLRRLLSVLFLVSSSILLFLFCIPSLRRLLHAVVKAEAGPGAAALEAVAKSLGEGGGDDGSAIRSTVVSPTYAASLLSLVAAAGAATADVLFSCIDTPPISNGLLGVGVSAFILWKLTELGNLLPLFRYSLGLSGLPPFSTFALSFTSPLFHPPSLCSSSFFLAWPVKPIRKKIQEVLSFASSPSESLDFASHPVFRKAFLGSSSPTRGAGRFGGPGESRRSSQRSSSGQNVCYYAGTTPQTPSLPLSPVGGGEKGSRTVTASSCWGHGDGGVFSEIGGGGEGIDTLGEDRKALHAQQHQQQLFTNPRIYDVGGGIETREGAPPVVGAKNTIHVFSRDNLTKFGASVILYILLVSLYLTGLGFPPFFLIPSSLQAACVYLALFFVPLLPGHLPLFSLPPSIFSSTLCGSPSSVSSEATSSSIPSATSSRTSHSSSFSFFAWPFYYLNPWSIWSSSIVDTIHTSSIYRLFIHHSPSRLLCQYPDIFIFPLLSVSFLVALRLFCSLASSLAAWLTVGERCPTARGGDGETFRRGDEEEETEDEEDDDDDSRHRKTKEFSLVQPDFLVRSYIQVSSLLFSCLCFFTVLMSCQVFRFSLSYSLLALFVALCLSPSCLSFLSLTPHHHFHTLFLSLLSLPRSSSKSSASASSFSSCPPFFYSSLSSPFSSSLISVPTSKKTSSGAGSTFRKNKSVEEQEAEERVVSLSSKRFQSFHLLFLYTSVLLLLLPLSACQDSSFFLLVPCLILSFFFVLFSSNHVKRGLLQSRRSFSGGGEALVDFLDVWLPLWKAQQIVLFAVTFTGLILSFVISSSSSLLSSSSSSLLPNSLLFSNESLTHTHHPFSETDARSPFSSHRQEKEGLNKGMHEDIPLPSSSTPEIFEHISSQSPSSMMEQGRSNGSRTASVSPSNEGDVIGNHIPQTQYHRTTATPSLLSPRSMKREGEDTTGGRQGPSLEDVFFSSSTVSSIFWFFVSIEQAVLISLVLLFSSWVLPATTPALRLIVEMAERELSACAFGFALRRRDELEEDSSLPLTCRLVSLPSLANIQDELKASSLLTRLSDFFSPPLFLLRPKMRKRKTTTSSSSPSCRSSSTSSSTPVSSLFEEGYLQRMDMTIFGTAAAIEIREEQRRLEKRKEATSSLPPVVQVDARQLSVATDQFIASLPRGPGSTAVTTAIKLPPSPAGATAGALLEKKRSSETRRVVNRYLGEWLLNRDKSESMSPLTQHLGIPWVVRQAVEKFTPKLTYSYDEGSNELSIATTLTVGLTKTIKLNLSGLGVEQSDEDAGGAWKSSTRVEGDLLKTVQRNESLKATLYETRRIIRCSENEDDYSKDQLWYIAHLHKDDMARDVIVNRYFDRVSGPPPLNESDTLLLDVAEDKEGERFHGPELVDVPSGSTTTEGGSTSTPVPPNSRGEGEEGRKEGKETKEEDEEENRILQEKGEQAVAAAQVLMDEALGPAASSSGWSISSGKRGTKVYQRDDPHDKNLPVIGMGSIKLNKGNITLENVVDYLTDSASKLEFDPQALKATELESLACGGRVMYQAFKGQWGFSGRDFVLLCYRKDVSEKRIIIGFRSNDGSYPREPPPEELWPPNAGEFVRATLLKGGYDIQVLDDGSIQISFLIQADLKTDGVPAWINKRVKAEQLNVVASIKEHLEKRYAA